MEGKGKKRKFTLAEQKNIADELKAKNAKYEMRKTRLILKLTNLCGVKINESR